MLLFLVTHERFLQEIRNEKLDVNSKDKLEVEDLGSSFAYYLTSFDRPKAFVYIVEKDELTDVQQLYLNSLSSQSIRITDSTQLTKITELLTKIDQNTMVHIKKD